MKSMCFWCANVDKILVGAYDPKTAVFFVSVYKEIKLKHFQGTTTLERYDFETIALSYNGPLIGNRSG